MAKKTQSKPSRKRVSFEIEANVGSTVTIAGSFNDWDCSKKALADKSDCGLFKCTMLLEPGSYEYKFVVDGTWTLDPGNPNFIPNDQGTLNSIITIE